MLLLRSAAGAPTYAANLQDNNHAKTRFDKVATSNLEILQ